MRAREGPHHEGQHQRVSGEGQHVVDEPVDGQHGARPKSAADSGARAFAARHRSAMKVAARAAAPSRPVVASASSSVLFAYVRGSALASPSTPP